MRRNERPLARFSVRAGVVAGAAEETANLALTALVAVGVWFLLIPAVLLAFGIPLLLLDWWLHATRVAVVFAAGLLVVALVVAAAARLAELATRWARS